MKDIPADWWQRHGRAATPDEWAELTFWSFREDLRDIPLCPPPAGYRIRSYQPGDAEHWVRIWQAAGLKGWDWSTRETFDHDFGAHLAAMPKRCIFAATDAGKPVGTVTAWFGRLRGRRWGMVHWYAIDPAHQGRGLGKPLLAEMLRRMRSLGHRRAMVGTQIIRLPAIKRYLDLGFRPESPQIRKLLRKHISHPLLKG